MKSVLIKCSFVILAFIAGISVYLLTASKHADFWKMDDQARVFFNGQPSVGSVVYRRPDRVRVLNTVEDSAWYVLDEGGSIEYCNSFRDRSRRFFALQLPRYLYVWHYGAYPCVGGVMFDVNPNTSITTNSVEFNSRSKARIRVTW